MDDSATVTRAAPVYWAPSTKEGWRHLVDAPIATPKRLTAGELQALSEPQRIAYMNARIDYLNDAVLIETPQVSQILLEARKRIMLNERKSFARNGLLVSGAPTLGKSTTVIRVGRELERRRRAQGHPSGEPGMFPVVYVTVPPSCGSKDMLIQFADFFGLPRGGRVSRTQLMSMISGVMREVRTELVIVDEIHNLDLGRQPSVEASDALKQLSEKCNATFIYAGIDLERSGLLSGARGQQIAGRFSMHTLSAFSNATLADRELWEEVIRAFEGCLLLVNQRPGTLQGWAAPLLEFTAGSIGRLSDLLRMAALEAMLDGSERITRRQLAAHGVRIPSASPASADRISA